MAEVNEGLKELVERDQIPKDEYLLEITHVDVTDKGSEMAQCRIAEAEDEELVGRRCGGYYLLNESKGQSFGLQRLMACMQWDQLPEDEETGKRDTRLVLKGVKFPAIVEPQADNPRFYNITPVLDEGTIDWQNNLLGVATKGDADDAGNEDEDEEKPRRSKKKASKKSAPAPAASKTAPGRRRR